jgi:hypothetical protein
LITFAEKPQAEARTPDVYVMALESAYIQQGQDFDDPKVTFPVATFKWVDGEEPAVYQKFIRVPKGFAFNEKANWFKLLGALVGRSLKKEDAAKLAIDLGPNIDSYDALCEAVAAEDGKAKVVIKSLAFDGESLYGKEAQLELDVNDRGYNKVKNALAVPKARKSSTKNPFEN